MKDEKIEGLFQAIKKLPPDVEWNAVQQFIAMQPATVYVPPTGGGASGLLSVKNGLFMITSAVVVGTAIQLFVMRGDTKPAPAKPAPSSDSNTKAVEYPLHLDSAPPTSGIMYGPTANKIYKDAAPLIADAISKPEPEKKDESEPLQSPIPLPPSPAVPPAPVAPPVLPVLPIGVSVKGVKELPAFSDVELYSSANVRIVAGDNYSVEGKDEWLQKSLIKVRGNKLQVYVPGEVDSGSDLVVKIPQNKLKRILILGSGNINVASDFSEVNMLEVKSSGNIVFEKSLHTTDIAMRVLGSGNIDINDFFSNTASINVLGSGSIYTYGNAKIIDVSVTGSGSADLEKLMVEEAKAWVSGSGSIKIQVNKRLVAGITGSGNISYRGNPEVLSGDITGSGEITHVE